MKNEQDFENLIQKLSPQASLPSVAFENRLRSKLLEKNKGPLLKRMQNSINYIFFGTQGIPFNHFGLLTAAVLVIAVLMSGLFVWRINQQENIIQPIAQISAQETYTVLRNVYLNNPTALITANSQTGLLTELLSRSEVTQPTVLNALVKVEADNEDIAITKDYNFFHVTYISTVGPLAPSCTGFNTDNSILNTYLYENVLLDNSKSYFFKSVLTDFAGVIKSSAITDNVATYIYEDGMYIEQPEASPMATDNTELISKTELSDIFGENSKLTKVEIGEKSYYESIVVKDIEKGDLCASENAEPRQLLIVNLIDPAIDYQIVATSYYLDIIDNEHLILKSENKYEKIYLEEQEALNTYFNPATRLTLKNEEIE